MKIFDFYKSVLSAGNLVVDEKGRVAAQFDGQSQPCMISGKQMVLPTREFMDQEDKSDIVIFNPLHENLLSGESPVMLKFRQAINVRTNYAILNLISQLVLLGVSPSMHSKLRPDQLDFIRLFKDADAKTLEVWTSLRKAMPLGNMDKSFVRLYIKSKADIGGKVHRRGAIVTFPFFEELVQVIKKGEKVVWGVRIDRKKDLAFFKALLENMFPGIGEAGSYSRGSVSDLAPTLDALLRGVMSLVEGVNGLVMDYGDVVEDIKELAIDSAWAEALDNFERFSSELRMIPAQAGNATVAKKEEQKPQLTGWAPPQTRPMLTVETKTEPAHTSSGKLDFNALSRTLMPQQVQQPFGYGGFGMPAPPRSGPPSWDRVGGFGSAPTIAQAGGWGNGFNGADI